MTRNCAGPSKEAAGHDEGAVSNSCAEGLQRHHAAELLHQRLLAEVTVSWVGKYDTGFQDNLMVWCLKMIKDIYAVDDYRKEMPA